jgi:hypothetical protein
MKLSRRIIKKLVILALACAPIAAGATVGLHYLLYRLGFPPALWFTLCCWALSGYVGFTLSIWVIRNNQEP